MNVDPLVLIVSLTAMVLALHANHSWSMKGLAERIGELEEYTGKKTLDIATAMVEEESKKAGESTTEG